jgi:hypothetical protein
MRSKELPHSGEFILTDHELMNATTEPALNIYQIKVTLLGTKPPIWRRVLVPASLTLAQLHDVLQIAMGWDDKHAHQFRAGQRRFGRPEPADPFSRMPRIESEHTSRLSTVLRQSAGTMIYIYDFGDGWEHEIALEKQLSADPGVTYPTCTDGQHACPPEDCGGIQGFYDLLDALADPNHKQHAELSGWIDDKFDPRAFSVDLVNRKLASIRRRAR